MAYIEENLRKRRGGAGADDDEVPEDAPYDPHEELFRIEDKYKLKKKPVEEEGNVTNSVAMLTAIPEVDLGMEYVPPSLVFNIMGLIKHVIIVFV